MSIKANNPSIKTPTPEEIDKDLVRVVGFRRRKHYRRQIKLSSATIIPNHRKGKKRKKESSQGVVIPIGNEDSQISVLLDNLDKAETLGNISKVEIHLPSANQNNDKNKIDHLKEAIYSYFATAEIEKDFNKETEEYYASWHFKDWFRAKIPTLAKESRKIYEDLSEAAKRSSIDKIGSENMLARASATKELLSSIKEFDEAIMRIGDVIIAKACINKKSRIVVVTISPVLARQLDENPMLLKDPKLFIKHTSNESLPMASVSK